MQERAAQRRSIEERLHKLAKIDIGKDKDNNAPEVRHDWGLWHPFDDLYFGWRVWRLSNFSVYPNGLPFELQDQRLIEDYFTLNEVYSGQAYNVLHPKRAAANEALDVIF